jgi:hypothetical protein
LTSSHNTFLVSLPVEIAPLSPPVIFRFSGK